MRKVLALALLAFALIGDVAALTVGGCRLRQGQRLRWWR
jgi:hypothetical protein